ncbi:MAG TPA: hypothetical protein DCM86_14525 [Verrucomicrobiales bacterium]|nr:hypothetical protein [Verrucomicrobiales bacterium]
MPRFYRVFLSLLIVALSVVCGIQWRREASLVQGLNSLSGEKASIDRDRQGALQQIQQWEVENHRLESRIAELSSLLETNRTELAAAQRGQRKAEIEVERLTADVAAHRAAIEQQNTNLKRQNEVIARQSESIREQNEVVKRVVGERDDMVRQLNERTREYNAMVEKYNTLVKQLEASKAK